MVYAIIYSLFLGFGITIGTALYGLMDKNATSSTTCRHEIPDYWKFIFVPVFTLWYIRPLPAAAPPPTSLETAPLPFKYHPPLTPAGSLTIINQATWKQTPMMILLAFIGYIVTFFSSRRFPSNAQISNTLGALTVGALGNWYSRATGGVAAALLLPAIFVQVPSGLAASGSLVSGVRTANDLLSGNTQHNDPAGGNYDPAKAMVANGTDSSPLDTVVFHVGYSMIQVAIGITVGLFLSALIVYPCGKRRSGLFSF